MKLSDFADVPDTIWALTNLKGIVTYSPRENTRDTAKGFAICAELLERFHCLLAEFLIRRNTIGLGRVGEPQDLSLQSPYELQYPDWRSDENTSDDKSTIGVAAGILSGEIPKQLKLYWILQRM